MTNVLNDRKTYTTPMSFSLDKTSSPCHREVVCHVVSSTPHSVRECLPIKQITLEGCVVSLVKENFPTYEYYLVINHNAPGRDLMFIA